MTTNYEQIRTGLLAKNEGYSTTVYLDTNGIPTIGTGVALLNSNGSSNTGNMQTLAAALGADSTLYSQIEAFADKVSAAISKVGRNSGSVLRRMETASISGCFL